MADARPPARRDALARRIRVLVAATISYNVVEAIVALTAALSLAVMPFLSAAQRRAGRELGSASAVADSQQTLLCTYLPAVLLVGLALNATLGWSWADPVAALVIAVVATKEGRDAWQGKGCCASPAAAAPPTRVEPDRCGCRPGCTCCD
ncbi:cation transporter [Streptomyces sp. NPDC059063]|uniref:cation transporter n=1 Tax=unclassified Streptomyces TaxID=2593676 RepID=UPI003679BA38